MLLGPSRETAGSVAVLVSALLAAPIARAPAQSSCQSGWVATLSVSDAGAATGLGFRVAMNAAGDRVVLGSTAHAHANVQSGAAWVLTDPGTAAQAEAELIPSFAQAGMVFSYSLAMNAAGDAVVVGASGTGQTIPQVYVYRCVASVWVEDLHVISPHSDLLGLAVATNAAGDVIALGAPARDVAGNFSVGGVDIYRHVAGAWNFETTVLPLNATGGSVGNSIALSADGNTLAARSAAHMPPLVQQNGVVYLFEHTSNGWIQVAALQEPVAYSSGGFGMAIALAADAHTIALGNAQDSRLAYHQGAVSVFREGATGWNFEGALLPSNATPNLGFGWPVAIDASGERVFAGGRLFEVGGVAVGGVEEFERTNAGWQRMGTYLAPNPTSNSRFGTAVRCSATGRKWIASEPLADLNGIDSGAVHMFESLCTSPVIYCTAKTNSLGCVPQIAAQGTPSASSSSGFTVSVSNTRNDQSGLLFYGTNGRCSLPWKGGTMCVQPPLMRTPLQDSGGNSAPANDCSGAYALDFNRWTAAGRDPALFAGQHVRAQYYSRDPGASFQLNLTDAVEFYLEP